MSDSVTNGEIPRNSSSSGHEKTASAAAHPPHGVSEEAWVALQQSADLTNLVKAIVTSPNAAKAIEGWLNSRTVVARRHAAARAIAAKAHLKAAFWSQVFFILALGVSLGFLAAVIWWLKDNRETLVPVLSSLIALIAGTGGGYVFGRASAGRGE